MGTDTNREAGVLQVRGGSISNHLGDCSRDGELGGCGVLVIVQEEKPAEFSIIKCERERRRISGSENLGWGS